MLKLKFKGGPWDGVEFDAPFSPNAIKLRDQSVSADRDPETGNMSVQISAPTEHHVYVLTRNLTDDYSEFEYEYKVNGKPYYEIPTQESPY